MIRAAEILHFPIPHPKGAFRTNHKSLGERAKWGILTPYPEAEWVFSPESIMPPRPIERSHVFPGHKSALLYENVILTPVPQQNGFSEIHSLPSL